MAKNWADLPPELQDLCSRQLLLLEDWFAFRSVCSTWRAAAFEERFDFPWLMLADDEKSAEDGWAEFRSLFSLRVHKALLPELKGKRRFSTRGWIFTVGDSKIHMLNPLSRAASRYRDEIIKLPSPHKVSGWDSNSYKVHKFVLSACPASSPNYTVMVVYSPYGPLGFWKPGNEEWKLLTLPDSNARACFADVISYKGRFVALNSSLRSILRCNLDGTDPTEVVLETPPDYGYSAQAFLVEAAGRLLLVLQLGLSGLSEGGTTGFNVFSIDLDTGKLTKLESMGNVSVFVGYNSSFSVHVDKNQQSIKPNCIYFSFIEDVGTYYMEDGRIEFDKKADFTVDPPRWIDFPPLWIEPSV